MRLSIVSPMYNERSGLAEFARQLEAALPVIEQRNGIPRGEIEVVLVDDGSTDGTATALDALAAQRGYRVIHHDRNRGLGAALWTAYDGSVGELVVAVDSDCTYPLVEVAALLERLRPDVDIVTASPYHPKGGVAGAPAFRLFLSRTLSVLYSLVIGRRLHTWSAMFRVYRRPVLSAMPRDAHGFIAVTQMLVLPILADYRVAEYPTVLYGRRFGQSKMKVARVVGEHLRFLAGLVARRARRVAGR